MNNKTVENDLCKHDTKWQRCKENSEVHNFSWSCPQFPAYEILLIFQDTTETPPYIQTLSCFWFYLKWIFHFPNFP